MINGDTERFLDTGWWNMDSTIYYNEHIYFFDGAFDEKHNMHVYIRRWKAINVDNKNYQDVFDKNGHYIDYQEIRLDASSEDALREELLKAPIWDGKTFWQVEKELAWLD